MPGRGPRGRAALVLVVLGVLAAMVYAPHPPTALAAPITPFARQFQVNDTGAVTIIGNGLLSCPDSDSRCATARTGAAKLNNNSFAMQNLDVDGDPSTVNSSSADLALPAGDVLWAAVYWGARLQGGPGGTTATLPARQLKFKTPGDSTYRQLTAERSFGPTTTADKAYQQVTVVTDLVRASGPGTYWGADIAAGTGEDRYAGWSLVVVYRDPTQPLRNLTVFDGFTDVGQGNPQSITIDGFLAPRAGPVDAQVGLVAYEGDYSATGDTAQLGGTLLGTALSPSNNYFNGTEDALGSSVTARNPSHLNNLGFDIKSVGAGGIIPNSATSETINLDSRGDRYFPGVVTTAINLFAPDFSPSTKTVVDLAGNDPAVVGDELSYTLTYTNIGQDPAGGAVLTDPLPAGVEYVPGSLEILSGPGSGEMTDAAGDDRGEYSPGSRTVTARLGTGGTAVAGGTISPGASTQLRFRATVTPSAAGGTVTNGADLAYRAETLGQAYVFSVPPVSTPVAQLADLAVTKTSTPDPTPAGDVVTSTIVVANNGPNPATATTLVDTFFGGALDQVSATTGTGSCITASGGIDCTLGTLGPGSTVTVTVTGRIPAGSTTTQTGNTSTVSSPTPDPDLTNNTATAAVQVTTGADLSVTKSVQPTEVTPGDGTTSTVVVTNDGPSDARDVLVTDEVDDPNTQFLVGAQASGADCQTDGRIAQCRIAVLPAGSQLTMQVASSIAAGLTSGIDIIDRVSVLSSTPDTDPADNTANGSAVTTAPTSDLALAKQVEPSTAVAGRQVSYVLEATNLGPSDAASTTVTDLLPAGLELVSAVPSRGSCETVPVLVCSLGTLLAGTPGTDGSTATITVLALIAPGTPAGELTNSAAATSTSDDPDTDNNAATAPLTVTTSADLSVTKHATPNPAVPGENITYTITVANTGPSVAGAVSVAESLPAEFAFISADTPSGSCGAAGPLEITCEIGDLAVDESRDVMVTMAVPDDFGGGDVTNTVTVDSDTPDSDPANNSASFTSTNQPAADLSILKTSTPADEVVAGERISWNITIANAGPFVAATPTVIDTLPDGVGSITVSPNVCTTAGLELTCTLGDVRPGSQTTITVAGIVDADVPSGTELTNVAVVSTPTLDPSTADNRSTASTMVQTVADVGVQKFAQLYDPVSGPQPGPAQGPPGSLYLFTIFVSNAGSSVARDVQVLDAFAADAGLGGVYIYDFDDPNPAPDPEPVGEPGARCQLVQGELACALGDLPPGQTTAVLLLVGVTSGEVQGTYANTATVSSSSSDPNPADNISTADVDITAPQAALAVHKTAVDGPTLVAGGPFSYRLDVESLLGGSDARGVVVTDTLPAGLVPTTAVASQGNCSITGQLVSCELGTVPGLLSAEQLPPPYVTITGTVAGNLSGPISNTGTVTADTTEPDTSDNSDTVQQTVEQQADLDLVKQATQDEFVAGGTASWSILVSNRGPSTATGIVLDDAIPDGVEVDLDASDDSCTATGSAVSCTVASLASGESTVVMVVGRIPPTFTGDSITNTVSLSTGIIDPTPAPPASAATPVVQRADLAVTKTASSDSPSVGSPLTYTITTINNGPSDAENVVVTDVLPAGIGPATVTADAGLTCTAAATVECRTANLAAGEQLTALVQVEIPDGYPAGPLDNTASVAADTDDPDLSNNTSTAVVNVQVVADTSIVKEVINSSVVAGADISYRLTARNIGPATAPATTISDTLPPGTTFVSATAAGGCQVDQQEGVTVVSCDVGAVAPGASAEAVLTIRLDPGASGVLTNEASVGSGALDPETADNVAGVRSTITAAVSTSVIKTGPAVLVPGRSATYTLAYRNDGPSTATDVVLADQIPDGLEFSAAPGCSLVGAGPVFVTCAVDPLGPGGSGQVEITFLVADSAVDGATILNAASIVAAGTESDQADNSSVVSGLVDTEPPGGTSSEQPSGSGVTTGSSSTTETTSSASTSAATGTSMYPTTAPTTLPTPQPGSGGAAGSGLSSTGVAVGGLLTVAALLLGAGLAFGLFGRRPGRRH